MEREEQRKQDEERKRLYSHNLRYTLSQKGYDVQPTLSQPQVHFAPLNIIHCDAELHIFFRHKNYK